jgi:uncharacterized protein with NRDE domain
MCTAIVLHRVIPSHPVVVAGNRDEWLARPAIAPHLWNVQGENSPVRIFAGKDQKEGGTWFGVNQYGLVVGVTNRYTGTRDEERASRGQLVLKCLAQNSVQEVLAILPEEEAARYNPFNLFCLSDQEGVVVTQDDQRFQRLPLEEGIHVITNRPPDDTQDPKREWLRSRLHDLPSDPDGIVEPVSQVLAVHGDGDFPPPVCVHLPGYGTVSSFMLLLSSQKEKSRYLYADGSPCQTEFEDLTRDLLRVFSPGP